MFPYPFLATGLGGALTPVGAFIWGAERYPLVSQKVGGTVKHHLMYLADDPGSTKAGHRIHEKCSATVVLREHLDGNGRV